MVSLGLVLGACAVKGGCPGTGRPQGPVVVQPALSTPGAAGGSFKAGRSGVPAGGGTGPTCPAPPAPQVQSELLRRWHRWHVGNSLREQRHVHRPSASARPRGRAPSAKLLLSGGGGGSNGAGRDPSAETGRVSSLPGLAESPF